MSLRPRRTWSFKDYGLLTLLMGVAIWGLREPLADIIHIGLREQEQSHIFLAPLVALWLLLLRRSRLRYVPVQPSLLGPAIVLIGWLIGFWGYESGVQIAWHGGALLTLLGVLLSVTGTTPLYLFAPVFVVLIFFLPVPGSIRHAVALPLQDMATTVTHATLEVIGISAVKTGNVLIINGEEIAVGEACNGLRMVFALTLVVYAFAFGTPLRNVGRVVLVALSPVVAIICNVIRLVPTSVIFGYGGQTAGERFHDIAGWVMLPVALVLLTLLFRAFKWLEFPVTHYRLANQ